ncbi:Wall-associated receptor kinase-like [Thalictrum thalictroides]|uniref:Wall-associated receptor kinase-like n=1 Tax=Thalictrum thalictroides TaxID=46969 RepID=A0A7J6WTT1_THATH|nr:Wall-associated receptor kinase-like [Thalictrum thalictroides]
MFRTCNHHHVSIDLLLFILLLIVIESSSHCNRSCGKQVLQFPFGFSDGCEIRLNCSKDGTGEIKIDQFQVQNVTGDSILVNLPAKCNRPINDLRPLFGQNYSLTLLNGLLLQNCSNPPNNCVIPRALMNSQFMSEGCNQTYCFSKELKGNGDRFMDFAEVENSTCKFLFSSISVDAANRSSTVSLDFQRIQLDWWLEGQCNCSANANCSKIIFPGNQQKGFRCSCVPGFHGDGFQAGNGCHKVSSDCNLSKYLSGKCGGSTRLGVLIGGVIAGASLVIGLAFVCYAIRQRSISLRSRENTNRLLSEAAGSFSVPFYTYKEIERATYSFSEKYKLGTGAYGTVYAGKLHNDEWVAIKKIRYRDRDGIESIMNEIKLISSVSHPNLVHLLGFCLEKGEQVLVYEFMPNGTLSQHLQREKGTGLPWTIRLNIATETAQAIAHLHSAMDPPIYHRDIKSSNILLDHNYHSKVADFGLSRLGMSENISHISTAPQGTPGYLDPQYHQNFHLSDRSDVYSFGVVLMEIITALKVVDFSRPPSEVNLAALAIEKIGKGCLSAIIDPFLEPERDAWTLSSINKMAELAFRCLAFHRDVRPSMTEVAAELEEIKLSGWVPMEENICTGLSVGSGYSSPSKGSEKSKGITAKKCRTENAGLGSRKLIVPPLDHSTVSRDEEKDDSPVSVNGVWRSEQSSPSTNSSLGNAAR